MDSESPELAAELFSAFKTALSSAFIGYSVATTLYGITCLQLYLYYRNHWKDHILRKILVGVLWVLDTLATAMVAHTLFVYLVLKLGETNATFVIPWSYALQTETVDMITFITQNYFAWQIWKVSGNRFVVAFIVFLATCALGLDVEVVVHLFRDPSELSLADPKVWVTGSTVQGLDALCDIVIMICFIYYLNSFRTGVKHTERVIDSLVIYAITRGIFTVVTQVVFVSLDVAFPGQVYWLPFQQTVGKLYVNSVLASLNARQSLQAPTTINFSEPLSQKERQKQSVVPPMSFISSEEWARSCIDESGSELASVPTFSHV